MKSLPGYSISHLDMMSTELVSMFLVLNTGLGSVFMLEVSNLNKSCIETVKLDSSQKNHLKITDVFKFFCKK